MGLLDNFANAPADSGVNEALLAAAQALLTPRARGGGLGAAFGAIPQAAQQAQANALRKRMLGLQEQQIGLQGQKLNFEMDEATTKRKREDALRLAQGHFWQKYAGKPVSAEMFAHGQLIGIKPDDLKALAESPNWGKTKLDFQNGVGVDPYTGQPKAVVPDVNNPFNPQIGPDGGISAAANVPAQQYGIAKAAAGAARNGATFLQEKEEDKAIGKAFGEKYVEIQNAGFSSQSRIAKIDRMEQLLDGLQTGKFTPAMTQVKSALDSLGIKVDSKLGAAQAVEALSNELALQARNTSSGAGMPGAMSDADRVFLKDTVPGLAKTPEGNRLLLETNRRLAKRDADVARIARNYRKKNGRLDEGFYEELQAFADANPLFSDMGSAPASPAAAPAAGSRMRYDAQSGRLVPVK